MTTKIEWAEESWNPVVGCSKISEGCVNCYAEKMALRLAHMALADIEAGRNPGRKRYYLDVVDIERKRWNGKVALVEEALEIPLQWQKPRTVFIPSMGDLFHEDVPFADIWSVWKIMRQCQQHTFLVLTKRAKRMADDVPMFYCAGEKPLSNVWGMVSVENQAAADERIPLLLQTPFAVRGVSCEPLLGAVDIAKYLPRQEWRAIGSGPNVVGADIGYIEGIDWVIAGGESGPGARPVHPDWLRGIRDQCQAAGVPYFFKQHGAWISDACDQTGKLCNHGYFCADGKWMNRSQRKDTAVFMSRIGKKAAGRLLDGRQWNEWPEAQ